MSIYKKVNNTLIPINLYKYIDNINNVQPLEVKNIYKKVNNQLLPVWHYDWSPSEWSKCTVECGGGTQTREVTCKRDNTVIKNTKYCENIIQPNLIQTCNTHTCVNLSIRLWGDNQCALYKSNINGDLIKLLGISYNFWASPTICNVTAEEAGTYIYLMAVCVNASGGGVNPIGVLVLANDADTGLSLPCPEFISASPNGINWLQGRLNRDWINSSCWIGAYSSSVNISYYVHIRLRIR